jgi:hypothetical protein
VGEGDRRQKRETEGRQKRRGEAEVEGGEREAEVEEVRFRGPRTRTSKESSVKLTCFGSPSPVVNK